MSEPLTLTCIDCDKRYEPETQEWAYIKGSGSPASGFDGGKWYWTGAAEDFAPEYELVEEPIFGLCGQRCGPCIDKFLDRRESRDAYDSDVPPAWFDSSYAGESWEEQ